MLDRLREQLADARRAGRTFDEAWPAALDQALDGARDPDWPSALEATRGAWHAAYERRPAPRRERAALALLPDVDAVRLDDDARLCARCGEPIAAGKRPAARYCSRACQRATHGRVAAALVAS